MININFAILLILSSFYSDIVLGQYTPSMPTTVSGWASSGNTPFGGNTTAYSDLKDQYILLATDLTSGAMVANDVLTSIGFYVSGGSTKTYNGLTIYLKHTTASTISAFDGTGLTLVYQANTNLTNTPGWKVFSFTNGFTWNGTNNILVSICWNNTSASLGLNTNYSVTSFPTGPNRSYSHLAKSGTGCSLTGTAGSSTAPFTRFGIQPKITSFTPTSVCASSNQTVTITGKYFTGTSSVFIGGTAASSFTVNSDTQITATIGAGTTGVISVTTPSGSGTSTSSITVKPKPIATALPNTQSICSGSTSSVSLSSNVSGSAFTWLTSSNANIVGESTTAQRSSIIDNTLTNSTTTSITLNYTVTPSFSGCTGTAITVPITVKPKPIATALPNTQSICSGSTSSVSLSSNVSGTTFTWLTVSNANILGESTTAQSSSNINNTLTNLTTSPITLNYTVIPDAFGCTGTGITVPIIVNPNPIVTANPSSETICSGLIPGISFTSNISGTTFSWSTTANANIGGESSTLQTGAIITDRLTNTTSSPITLNYIVTPKLSGCSGSMITIPITINPSLATVSSDGPTNICQGSSVLLIANTGTGLIYQWYLNNSIIAGENNSILFVNSSGNYSVSVLNNFNCTSNSDTIPVIVNTNPPIPIISTSSPTIFCHGDSVMLSVLNNPSLNYQWQINGTNILNATFNQFIVFNSGTYSIIATNMNNCFTGSSNLGVTVYELPISEINSMSSTTFCEGDSVVLQGHYIATGIYSWSDQNGIITNSDTSSITIFDTGSYTYEILDSNTSCYNQSDTIQVIVNTHNPSEIYTTSLGPFVFNGTNYTESGIYLQNLQTVKGCDSTLTLNLIVQSLNIDFNDISDSNFTIFPNPVGGNKVFFTISPSVNLEVIEITSISGQKIQFETYHQMIQLPANTKSGIYFIHFSLDEHSVFYPIIINE